VIPHGHKVVGDCNLANYTFIYHTNQEPNIFFAKSIAYRDLSDEVLRERLEELTHVQAINRDPQMTNQLIAVRNALYAEIKRREDTSDPSGNE